MCQCLAAILKDETSRIEQMPHRPPLTHYSVRGILIEFPSNYIMESPVSVMAEANECLSA